MRVSLAFFAACAFLLSLPHTAAAVLFQENFDSGVLNPHLSASASSGFSYDLTGGTLNLHMAPFSPRGSIGVSTDFQVTGDFTATVDVTRINLVNALGIGAYRSGGGGANVFFWGTASVISNMFTPAQIPRGTAASSNATFRIRRSGTTLFGEILNGTTWQVINSATSPIFADPLTITLFLDNEYGTFIGTQNGSFDNLTIQAAGFRNFSIPAPATWTLMSVGLLFGLGRRRGAAV